MEYTSFGAAESYHRLVILTDMENEPDDSQTMVKLLMYSNELDIEGLIAVSSRWLQDDNFPESIYDRVKAYGVVRDNLMKHAPGWPTEEELLGKIAGGQRGFGMAAVGDGRNTAGSDLIIAAIDKEDSRPVHFAINAGANTLAQALWDIRRTRSPEELARFIAQIRVYDDSGQDDAGAWMCHTFPDLFYVRSRAQVFGLFGPTLDSGPQPWKPLDQFSWAEVNIRTRHGILGALYPQRLWFNPPWNAAPFRDKPGYAFMDGGGTASWLGLINKGLYDPAQISWGGWGGRFSWQKEQVPAGQHQVDEMEGPYQPFLMYPQAQDLSWKWEAEGAADGAFTSFSGVSGTTEYTSGDFAPLWRWREAYTNDFKARMDWCVTEYGHANHHPIVNFLGDENRTICTLVANPEETVELDASGSRDPDGDQIDFRWNMYPEAGDYPKSIEISNSSSPVATVAVPEEASGRQIHIILEVTDRNAAAPLTSYRRIVLNVS
jgi:hypothetical protein